MKNTSKILSTLLLQSGKHLVLLKNSTKFRLFKFYRILNRFLVTAICEYNIPQKIAEDGKLISGFKYSKTEDTTWPPPSHLSGTGNVTIPLAEGYKARQWTIQLRWPLELMDLRCWENSAKEKDCGGDPTNSLNGETCSKQHYHMTAHFYDDTTHLSREITTHWPYGTEWGLENGPIPCIDWCSNGVIPEYPGSS